MDPSSDTGLVTPPLQHGCSTITRENDWVEVTSKSGGNKRKTKDTDNKKKSYAKAAKTSKLASMEREPSILGCTPIVELKNDCNRYSSLSYNKEHRKLVDKEVEVVIQHLNSAVNTYKEPSKKKLKTNKDHDDFNATCKYYAELLPPEYAHSVKATNEN